MVCQLSSCLTSISHPCSLHCSHTGLFAIPQTHQGHSYLRVFVLVIPGTWECFPTDISMFHFLTSFRTPLKCHLRESFPYHPILRSISLNGIKKTRNKPSCLFSVEYQEYQENSMGKEESFQQMGLGQLDIHMQRNAGGLLLYNV